MWEGLTTSIRFILFSIELPISAFSWKAILGFIIAVVILKMHSIYFFNSPGGAKGRWEQ